MCGTAIGLWNFSPVRDTGDNRQSLQFITKPVKMDDFQQKLEQWIVSVNEDQAASLKEWQIVSSENMSEIIDLSILESFRDYQQPGEPDLVGKLIDLFVVDTTGRISVIKQAIIDGDSALIKREAHNAKGGAGNIGARRMAACCKELEQKAAQSDEAAIVITQLESEFRQVIEVLNNVKQPERDQ